MNKTDDYAGITDSTGTDLAKDIEKTQAEQDEERLQEARELFALADEGTRDIRRTAADDNEFYNGNMWDDTLRAAAEEAGEPLRQIPRLHVLTKQIENDLSQQEMSLTITPTDEQGSEKTAEMMQGMVRGIENMSNARRQYMHAAGEAGALVVGFGFIQLELDYAGNDTFNQNIYIRAVKDPFSVLWDPNCQEPDFSDADFWFQFKDYPEKQFKVAFPEAVAQSVDLFPAGTESWYTGNSIRVARYWYKKETSTYTYLLDDGSVIQEKDVLDTTVLDPEYDGILFKNLKDEDKGRISKLKIKENAKVIRQNRQITSCEIWYMDFTGAEILHDGKWEGDYFPLVAFTGPQFIVEGKRGIRSVIHNAIDAQKDLNYYQSKIIVRLQQTNKAKYIVDGKSIQMYEQDWYQSNRSPGKNIMRWNSQGVRGEPIAPPVVVEQRAPIEDLLQLKQSADIDIQRGMGIFDAGVGATPNDQSGIAIKTLAENGRQSSSHHGQNFGQGLHTLGVILIDLIPKIYHEKRIVKTVSPEGEEEMQAINDYVNIGGEDHMIDVAGAAGHYGVNVDIGPGYASKKQEALEGLLALVKIDPTISGITADIMARNMDYPQADLIADRLLRRGMMQFPGIIEDPKQGDVPPAAQAQMAQMQQKIQQDQIQIQQLSQQAQQFKYIIDTKQTEIQGEMALTEKKHMASMQEGAMKREADGQIAQLRGQFAMDTARLTAAANHEIATRDQIIAETNSRLDYEIALRKANTDDRKVNADLVIAEGDRAAELVNSEVPGIDKTMDAAANNDQEAKMI